MANGNFAGGDGTINNPYLVEDAHDLNAVRNNLTAHYKLIKDIDLGIATYNQGEGWVPIGDYSTNTALIFKGVFDGNGFKIKNLFINRPAKQFQGLFGRIEQATIKNIGVEDVNVIGSDYTGGLVGYNYNSSVIENSYSTGSVTGGSNTGGLVGRSISSSIIKNSYSTGSVIGSDYTGGLVGYNYISSIIENSYSTGSVTGSNQTGGLVGYNNNSSIINSYWDKETSGWTTSAGGTGKTTLEMQTPSTFVGWGNEKLEDGTLIWILNDGEYPKLWFEKPPIQNKILIRKSDGVYVYFDTSASTISQLNGLSEKNLIKYGMDSVEGFNSIFTNKNYILTETDSKDVNGLWTTQINRKPLSIKLS